jgi:hypothetical protein
MNDRRAAAAGCWLLLCDSIPAGCSGEIRDYSGVETVVTPTGPGPGLAMMMSERREASEPYLLKDKGRRCVLLPLGGAHLAGSAELSIEQRSRIPYRSRGWG